MSDQPKKLILIDGNNIAYRAFFALPPLSNKKGQQTNAVYGFTQMLLRLIHDEKPTHIAIAFDAAKRTFRHEVYSEYKGTRQKTPPELSEQFPMIHEVVSAFRIPAIQLSPYEADDVIGTLSQAAESAGIQTLVVSGDKDLLQLVSPTVHAAFCRKGITEVDKHTPETIREKYGLSPQQIIDLKGLMGDSSDNIPGVPGIGEKTALKLLQLYPTVEDVLFHVDEVPGAKLQERLRENAEKAIMSKGLATIKRDVPLMETLDELAYSGYDRSKLRSVFQELEFKSLIDKISGEMTAPSDASTASLERVEEVWKSMSYQRVNNLESLQQMLTNIDDTIGIIPDMLGGDYHRADIKGFALATKSQAYYVSFESKLRVTDLVELWTSEFEKVAFDIKSLVVALDAHGVTLDAEGAWFDALLASYLLNPSDGEIVLGEIIERELHEYLPTESKVTEPELREALLCRYATLMPQLQIHLVNALNAQELDDLYNKVELPLAFVLSHMEALGFHLNEQKLRQFGDELSGQLADLTISIHDLAGSPFNINSPKQLGEILFEKLGLPAQKKTKTGYSTSADVLEKLAPYHEIIEKILAYRQLAKLQSTYVEGLLKVIKSETGRVHTRFHQALTATGRLSSTEPNLQNIPIRLEEGRKLRQIFEPTYQDWLIVSADYSQIELRILAHISEDEAMIEAFRQGMDIHTRTASDVFEVSPDQVTSLMRRQAKAVNFGIVYGISDYGLSQNLGITRAEAARFIDGYFAKFPGVSKYMEDIVGMAKKAGYVTTLLNRRRYLPDLHSRNFNLRSFAERTAMNTPIQGTAADIIKLAMVRIEAALAETDMKSRMLLQVHDELIFECPTSELEALTTLVRDNMENAMTLNVPLQVDINYGPTWYEAK